MIIHQTLHGYSDGHRLLESSTRLSSNLQATIAVLSDVSGPTSGSDFSPYLTGYPLGKNAYALGRTWHAPEMPRPGSVWTHTLILQKEDLQKLQDITELIDLFRRPQINLRDAYRTSLKIDDNRDNSQYSNNRESIHVRHEILNRIYVALYKEQIPTVRLIAKDCKLYEPLVLALWMQQWSTLRQSFTFCTLAFKNRFLEGRPFDLELIPQERLSALSSSSEIFMDGNVNAKEGLGNESWARIAAKDLFARDHKLHDFLEHFGRDVPFGKGLRAAFTPLLEIYAWLETSFREESSKQKKEKVSELISLVAKGFPVPEDAASLKKDIFGKQDGQFSSPLNFIEPEVLFSLSTTGDSLAFNAEDLSISKRAVKLWATDPQAARRLTGDLLHSDQLNPIGQEFLSSVYHCIDSKELVRISSGKAGIIAAFIRKNPKLATSPYVWSVSEDVQREIWDALKAVQIDESLREAIIGAMMNASCDAIARDVVETFRRSAVLAIMNWINEASSSGAQLSSAWTQALTERPSDLITWLSSIQIPNLPSASVLANTLDPNSSEVDSINIEVWLGILKELRKSKYEFLDLKAFLLCFALRRAGDIATQIAADTFEPVHDTAAKNNLNYRIWSFLQQHLPHIWSEWDRCERLRRGACERFVNGDWNPIYFTRAIREADTFEQCVNYCRRLQGHVRFFKILLHGIETSEIEVTGAQKKILLKQFKRLR